MGIVDRREAVRYALEQMRPGDMLLLCGKGREGYQLVQGKKIPYDEEETVRSCARERCWSPAHRPCDRDKGRLPTR